MKLIRNLPFEIDEIFEKINTKLNFNHLIIFFDQLNYFFETKKKKIFFFGSFLLIDSS